MIVVAAPLLSGAFSAFVFVRNRANKLKINQLQILRLVDRCEDFIKYADVVAKKKNLSELSRQFENLLKDIEVFLAEHAKCQLLQRVLNADGFHRSLKDFNERLTSLADSIECQLFLDAKKIRDEDEEDKKADNVVILKYLQELENREEKLIDALELREEQYMEALFIMEKRMKMIKNDVEKQFLISASSCIQRLSGQQASKEKWLIPQWEITLKHKIASGGYGDIYIGEWNRSNVAIKVMRKTDKRTERLKDFVKEVEVWYFELNHHPHVLNLYGACHTVEKPFMVCEYMQNGHLISYLKRYPDQRIRTLKEAALGMRHLHENSVIHGDMKAINILVNGEGTAKVCDFGFSFVKDAEEDPVVIGGTLRWMAPELMRKEQPDFPVDSYAFGMTIYEVFNNYRPPYCGDSDEKVKQIVMNGGMPAKLVKCDPRIWHLITNCLIFDSYKRYSFQEIIDDLSNIPGCDIEKPAIKAESNPSSVTNSKSFISQRQKIMDPLHDTEKQSTIIDYCEGLFAKNDDDSIKKGIDILYKHACEGNVKAQIKLGDMHSSGRYVNTDLNIALEYFKKAAESDNDYAHLRLGYFYLKQCQPPKYDKGMIHLRRAADKGNPSAMNFFGKEIQKERPQDAFQWFLLAAEKKYMKAYLNLGECYLRGVGITLNIPRAIEALTIAAEQGNNPAAWKLLGIIYANLEANHFIEPFFDINKAIFCLKSAIDSGYKQALIELSQIYFHGFGMQMPEAERLDISRQLLLDAVRELVVPAFFLMGKSYEKGLHQAPNIETATHYYRMGAQYNCSKCKAALQNLQSTSLKKMASKVRLVQRVSMAFK
eukprot:NODE_115_length_18417_cov_0.666012.p2 type:complete len:826 gc:universal NODE_115_length_18417_cov_0.666012:18219-15742(-)